MIKAVIFDKDGTLLELGTIWDKPTVDIINQLLNLTHYNDNKREEIRQMMGIKNQHLVPNSLSAIGSIREQASKLAEYIPLTEEELVDTLSEAYLNFVESTDLRDAIAPGVIEMLNALKQDYYLALITNDNKAITLAMLEQIGLLPYFKFIGCADEFQAKPNPAALFELARRTSYKLDEMVYVGDSTIDMIYGKNTAAAIGYAPNKEGIKHVTEADFIIKNFNELPDILKGINADE